MKYIKPINEFSRTIGFKYTQPSVRFNVLMFCKGELTNEQFTDFMDFIDVKFEKLNIKDAKKEIQIDDSIVESDIVVEFDILAYGESEIETITEQIQKGLNREFEVQTFEMFYKLASLLKKK